MPLSKSRQPFHPARPPTDKPLTDARYLEYVKGLKLRFNKDEIESNEIDATNLLWDDLIIEVENTEFDAGAEWRQVEKQINEINSLRLQDFIKGVDPGGKE